MMDPDPRPRLLALDWMRGLVILLMVSDHAGHVFYQQHLIVDGAFFPQRDLPALPFLHRWLSHPCAPSFVFLAGVGIMLSRLRHPEPDAGLIDRGDRLLLLRGALLVALDLSLISMIWGPEQGTRFVLQVLFALGVGMWCMVGLRRLSFVPQLVVGLVLLAGVEALLGLALQAGQPGIPVGLLLTGVFGADLMVIYPALPWLGAMVLGAAFGRALGSNRMVHPVSCCMRLALGCLVIWLLLRFMDGYGHMGLHRSDDALLRWLHLSKYPPSLTYLLATLGLMFACLAGLFALQVRRPQGFAWDPLLLLGQTPLLFYILHIPLLHGLGHLLPEKGGLGWTWMMVLACCVILLPICAGWRRLRRRHPRNLCMRLL